MNKAYSINLFLILITLGIIYASCTKKNTMTNSIEQILKEQVDRNKTPSIQYFLFDTEKIISSFSYGRADIKSNIPVGPDMTFNAFSVTKTFTGLAVLQLAERGRIDLNDPVSTHLTDFSFGDDITVKQLLSHTAGIPNPIPLKWIHLISEHANFDSKSFFRPILSKNNKVKSQPNDKFRYSNLGYVLLGRLIEKVSAVSYEEYIHHHIIEPLGLGPSDLGFQISDPGKHVKGYQKKSSFF